MNVPFTIAFLAFVLVKLIGYALAAKALRRVFPDARGTVLGAAFVRLLIGLGTVLVLDFGGQAILGVVGLSFGFLAVRFAFRFVEWRLFLALFHPRATDGVKIGLACAAGAVYTELLDLPAILLAVYAFSATGGRFMF
jgi:hypothetical protein